MRCLLLRETNLLQMQRELKKVSESNMRKEKLKQNDQIPKLKNPDESVLGVTILEEEFNQDMSVEEPQLLSQIPKPYLRPTKQYKSR